MGINREALPQSESYHACDTRHLAFAFADVEEDECVDIAVWGVVAMFCRIFLTSSHQCRVKLLCAMTQRIQHLEASLSITSPVVAYNGVPLPVAVGLLRGVTMWSVLFMWRDGTGAEDSPKLLCWQRLIEGSTLDTPTGFLHYTNFMYRLFCYGRLFKEAIQSLLDPQVSCKWFFVRGWAVLTFDPSEARETERQQENQEETEETGLTGWRTRKGSPTQLSNRPARPQQQPR
jgi:hypothetical protein